MTIASGVRRPPLQAIPSHNYGWCTQGPTKDGLVRTRYVVFFDGRPMHLGEDTLDGFIGIK